MEFEGSRRQNADPTNRHHIDADKLGEESIVSKAQNLSGKHGRKCSRHKREGNCVFPGEVYLDDLDKELERRGSSFCRYADGCNLYVYSQRAGERVKASVTKYLLETLKLKVNENKSAVVRPWKGKFLGYTVTMDKAARHRASERQLNGLKTKSGIYSEAGEDVTSDGSSKRS